MPETRTPFFDVCKDVTKTATKIPTADYLPVGKYKIFDQGKNLVGGFRDSDVGLAWDVPYILFGDHTRVIKYIDEPCFIGADGVKLLKVKDSHYTPKYIYYAMKAQPIENQGYARHFKFLKEQSYKYTKIEKQEKIVEELDNIEEGIRVKETQLKALDELIQSRFTEMFGKRFLSERIPLKNIATFTIGLTYKPVNVSKDGIIVLRSGNIQNNRIELEDDIVRVSNIKIPDDKFIKENDILMCARNGSAKLVGKSCLISNLKEPMTFGAFMTVVRSRYPYFLQSFFTSSFFKAQLVNTATASVKQITSTMLGDYLVIQTSDTDETQFAQFVQQVEKAKEIVKIQIKDLQELLALKMDEYFK